MSKTPLESDGLIDRRSITPMKAIVVPIQTTLQPTVDAQHGTSVGEFKFNGFEIGGVLVMQIVPAYRIVIDDCWARGNATPNGADEIVITKIDALGNIFPIAILAFAGTLIETVRYTVSTGAIANFTIDPNLGEFIKVEASGAGITGGATVTIMFNLV